MESHQSSSAGGPVTKILSARHGALMDADPEQEFKDSASALSSCVLQVAISLIALLLFPQRVINDDEVESRRPDDDSFLRRVLPIFSMNNFTIFIALGFKSYD